MRRPGTREESPWENGYIESFNGKLRDELLNGEIFYTLADGKVVIEGWRRHYNTLRPHSSLGYKPPAPEVVLWQGSVGLVWLSAGNTDASPIAALELKFNPDHRSRAGQVVRATIL